MAVLHAAPVVCVSRMDLVKLEEFRDMGISSTVDFRVNRIMMSLVGLKVAE